MSLVRALWDFSKAHKKFWLALILVVIAVLSTLIGLAASAPVWTPFIYSIF